MAGYSRFPSIVGPISAERFSFRLSAIAPDARAVFAIIALSALSALSILAACSSGGASGQEGTPGNPSRIDTSSQCDGICDASPPGIPELTDTSGFGDITTYGDVADPAPSRGGACNYGATGISAFAAIQVNRLPGDLRGQWNGGRICGQCLEVKARTPEGWKSTVVRIVDKCPDAYCGVDLGGAPARELMGSKPGRYSGAWRFVSCEGIPGASDGPPALYVKDGANGYWSLVQVRNAAERIVAMRMRRSGAGEAWVDMEWADEAENFFRAPDGALRDTSEYELEAVMPHGSYALRCRGTDLAEPEALLPFSASP